MSKDLRVVLEKIDYEITDLHFRWGVYRDVFAQGPEQIALLNRNGSNFFHITQLLMIDYMTLAFSKLTDPSKQGKNENLSLKQLHVLLEEIGEAEVIEELNMRFEVLYRSCEKFRELRNKRVAHSDMRHALELAEEPLPGISRAYIEEALVNLRDYINVVNRKFKGTTVLYQEFVEDLYGRSENLIRALNRSEASA